MSKQLIDFHNGTADTSDTGEDLASSVRPVLNTQPASEATFNRPTENLRSRTEILRGEVEGLKYLVDADRALLLSGGGEINWNKTTKTFTIAADLSVRPFLAPKTSKTASLTFSGLTITADYPNAAGAPKAYGPNRGANDISVEFAVDATTNDRYAVTVTGAPANNLKITVSTNSNAIATLDGLVTFLNGNSDFRGLGLTASGTGATALTSSFVQAATRLTGALDAEIHVITAKGLADFFAADSGANKLNDGDCLAIYYAELVDSNNGGRRQSLPEYGNTSVNDNLVNLGRFPERTHLAIPICTREGDNLVFLDGTRIKSGVVGSLGGVATGTQEFSNLLVDGTSHLVGKVTADAQIESTVVGDTSGTGSAPFVVASSKKVTNLNADKLDGYDWADVPSLGTASTTVTAGTVYANGKIDRSTSGVLRIASDPTDNSANVTSIEIGTAYDPALNGQDGRQVQIGYGPARTGDTTVYRNTTNVWGHLNVYGNLNATSLIGRTAEGDPGPLNIGNDNDVTDINIGTTGNSDNGTVTLGRSGIEVNVNGDLNANGGLGRSSTGALSIGNDSRVTDVNIGTANNTGAVNLGYAGHGVNVNGTLTAKPASSGQTDSVLSVKKSDGTTKLFDIAPDGTVTGTLRNVVDYVSNPVTATVQSSVSSNQATLLTAYPPEEGGTTSYVLNTSVAHQLTAGDVIAVTVTGLTQPIRLRVYSVTDSDTVVVVFDKQSLAQAVDDMLQAVNPVRNPASTTYFEIAGGTDVVYVGVRPSGVTAGGLTLKADGIASGATALKFSQSTVNTGDLWRADNSAGTRIAGLSSGGSLGAQSLAIATDKFTVSSTGTVVVGGTLNATGRINANDSLYIGGTAVPEPAYASYVLAVPSSTLSLNAASLASDIFGTNDSGCHKSVTWTETSANLRWLGATTVVGTATGSPIAAPTANFTALGTALRPANPGNYVFSVNGQFTVDANRTVSIRAVAYKAASVIGGTVVVRSTTALIPIANYTAVTGTTYTLCGSVILPVEADEDIYLDVNVGSMAATVTFTALTVTVQRVS